jgi:hypothetical protein
MELKMERLPGAWWRILSTAVVGLAVALTLPGPAVAQTASPLTQTSVAAQVTVKVTPGRFTVSEWPFAVVFDTHSQQLDDDLMKSAVLLVDGIELHPAQWTAPAGGHHREGTLVFSAPSRAAGGVELRITRLNEPAARTFRWDGPVLQQAR